MDDFVDAYQKHLWFMANQSSLFSESSQKDQHTASHIFFLCFFIYDVWIWRNVPCNGAHTKQGSTFCWLLAVLVECTVEILGTRTLSLYLKQNRSWGENKEVFLELWKMELLTNSSQSYWGGDEIESPITGMIAWVLFACRASLPKFWNRKGLKN